MHELEDSRWAGFTDPFVSEMIVDRYLPRCFLDCALVRGLPDSVHTS
jgi:hypothetical protein